jgi:hypothetical protein
MPVLASRAFGSALWSRRHEHRLISIPPQLSPREESKMSRYVKLEKVELYLHELVQLATDDDFLQGSNDEVTLAKGMAVDDWNRDSAGVVRVVPFDTGTGSRDLMAPFHQDDTKNLGIFPLRLYEFAIDPETASLFPRGFNVSLAVVEEDNTNINDVVQKIIDKGVGALEALFQKASTLPPQELAKFWSNLNASPEVTATVVGGTVVAQQAPLGFVLGSAVNLFGVSAALYSAYKLIDSFKSLVAEGLGSDALGMMHFPLQLADGEFSFQRQLNENSESSSGILEQEFSGENSSARYRVRYEWRLHRSVEITNPVPFTQGSEQPEARVVNGLMGVMVFEHPAFQGRSFVVEPGASTLVNYRTRPPTFLPSLGSVLCGNGFGVDIISRSGSSFSVERSMLGLPADYGMFASILNVRSGFEELGDSRNVNAVDGLDGIMIFSESNFQGTSVLLSAGEHVFNPTPSVSRTPERAAPSSRPRIGGALDQAATQVRIPQIARADVRITNRVSSRLKLPITRLVRPWNPFENVGSVLVGSRYYFSAFDRDGNEVTTMGIGRNQSEVHDGLLPRNVARIQVSLIPTPN